jgi:Holliday junction resolvase RusA-like endonuclease
MSKSFWYVLPGVNPVPWTAPSVSIGRKNGKPFPMVYSSAELKNYKTALAEAVEERYPERGDLIEDEIALRFFFWRRLDPMEGNKRRKGHVADATNLQKAAEDALQGVLFKNDQQVIHAESWVMAQHDAVDPCVVVELTWHPDRPALPDHVQVAIEGHLTLDLKGDDNVHDVPVEDFL